MRRPLKLFLSILLLITACAKAPVVEPTRQSGSDIESMQDHEGNVKLVRQISRHKTNTKPNAASKSAFDLSAAWSGYGYSDFMNLFLGTADYMRWENPNITTVVRVSLQSKVDRCAVWDLKLSSNRPMRFKGGTQSNSIGHVSYGVDSILWKWKGMRNARNGMVLSLEGNQSRCNMDFERGIGIASPEIVTPPVIAAFDPFAVAIGSKTSKIPYKSDPYAYGWDGDFLGGYYSYPPPVCGADFAAGSFVITGTITPCDSGASEQIYLDFSDLLNMNDGYSHWQQQTTDWGNRNIAVRTVNYDGNDWGGVDRDHTQNETILYGTLLKFSGNYHLKTNSGYYRLNFQSDNVRSDADYSLNQHVGVTFGANSVVTSVLPE